MQSALKLKTTILPGRRIEVTAPELPENGEVELIIVLPEKTVPALGAQPQVFASALDYLNSLPPIQRTPEEWAEVERQIQEEKNSWNF